MNFTQALANYIGRRVLVYTADTFFSGVLTTVEPSYITLQVTGPGYTPTQLMMSEQNIHYVRILAVA